jgi:hypothetical protein
MEPSATKPLQTIFRNDGAGYKFLLFAVIFIGLYLFLMAISPLVRLYTLAYMGNSEAMYNLADEYGKHPSKIVWRPNVYRGSYWIRKSANKGNLHAIQYIDIAWGRVNPDEVVIWLRKGIEFDHPWCAEQVARGYKFGLYGLPIDKVKEVEYRNIGARLRAEGKGSPYD